MRKVFISLLFIGCNQPFTKTKVKCQVDSIYKKQLISVTDQVSPCWVYHTKCGNVFSTNDQQYKIGDSIVFLIFKQ